MSTKITMPQLGESVSEGTVGRWLKNEGDSVKKDEPLVEIVTDKITEEMPSPFSGTLARILVKENETVKVGAEIAEMETAAVAAATSSSSGSPAARPASVTAESNFNGSASTDELTNGSRITARDKMEKVSPLARRLAQEHAIDLSEIKGSGEGGRVRKEDILAHLAARPHGV